MLPPWRFLLSRASLRAVLRPLSPTELLRPIPRQKMGSRPSEHRKPGATPDGRAGRRPPSGLYKDDPAAHTRRKPQGSFNRPSLANPAGGTRGVHRSERQDALRRCPVMLGFIKAFRPVGTTEPATLASNSPALFPECPALSPEVLPRPLLASRWSEAQHSADQSIHRKCHARSI